MKPKCVCRPGLMKAGSHEPHCPATPLRSVTRPVPALTTQCATGKHAECKGKIIYARRVVDEEFPCLCRCHMRRQEDREEVARRLRLQGTVVQLANALKGQMPPNTGFALLLFDYGPDGAMAYASSAERRGMLEALRELVSILEDEAVPPNPEAS